MLNFSWTTWIIILVVILFLLWLFYGGKEHEFLGISPLLPPEFPEEESYIEICTILGEEDQGSPVLEEIPEVTPKEDIGDRRSPRNPKKEPEVSNLDIGGLRPHKRWKRQEECCRIIEEIFGQPFRRDHRPNFLKNPETGRNLELDCYSPELQVALEYNGEQHYKYPNAFHRSEEQWKGQVRRDEYKIKACDRNGVYLVTIPYTIPNNKLKEEILRQLEPIL